jgi:hypothetical protein
VEICHLDSEPTASLRLFADRIDRHEHVQMFDATRDAIPNTIPITDEPPLPWSARPPRLLAHGGGWGLGTYRSRAGELLDRGLAVDLVGHDLADVDHAAPDSRNIRYFLIDPAWEAWVDGGFPPFGEARDGRVVEYRRRNDHHDSFELARRSIAMVCKTGGGSLLDSLWAATPIVTLEPFGTHEHTNAQLWQRLGFGVPFDVWRDSGFSVALLERLHHNLLAARTGVPDYTAKLLSPRTRTG